MFFENVSIAGLAYQDAPHVTTSVELENELQDNLARFGMRPNLIESLTGIRERRFWENTEQAMKATVDVVENILAQAEIKKSEVGVLINSSVSKEFIEPSVAAIIHGDLAMPPECMNFDISNACLGFLNAMEVAGNMIERGQIDYAIIVDAENAAPLTTSTLQRLKSPDCTLDAFRARFASLTLGSTTVAMLLSHKDKSPTQHQFLGGVSRAATQHNRLCVGRMDDMTTDASGLLMSGIELTTATYKEACEKMAWHQKDFAHYLLHQVGETHLNKVVKAMGVDPDKVPRFYQTYGNTGPASIPLALAKMQAEDRLSAGDRMGLMGIGSGINCSMMELVW